MYGKCIAANYQNVSKDMCAKEFMMLKDCYLVRLFFLLLVKGQLIVDIESSRQEMM